MIVAGGSGRRIGGPVRKQYLEIDGIPVLLRAVVPFLSDPRIQQVVVVLPADDVEAPPHWLASLGVRIVAGGAERGDSVWNGLTAVTREADYVLVHDGARPFITSAVVDRVLEAAPQAAIAAVPVTDTIKEVDGDGTISGTPARARLWQAQTPQGFPLDDLLRAYRLAREQGFAATDDAALYANYVGPVRVVRGSYKNLKVTHGDDLPVAEALAVALASGRFEVE